MNNHYEIFIKVAELENFSKAASELFLTQPAVSQAIRSLENDLGLPLFTRHAKGVRLTPEGQIFHDKIKEGIAIIRHAEREMKELKELKSGMLRLGVSDIVSRYVLPSSLKRFTSKYPRIQVKILNGTTRELEQWLHQGEIDLVIGFQPEEASNVHFHKIMDIHDVFAACRDVFSTLPRIMSYEQLAEQKLIMLDTKSEARNRMSAHFRQHGVQLKPDMELASHDLLIEFARQGLGIACINKEFSLAEDLEEIILNKPLPKRVMGYYSKNGTALNQAAKAFVRILEEDRHEYSQY